MTPVHQPVGLKLGGRRYRLSSDRELRLGVCFWFRLFNVAPETTARFSRLDDRSRDHSPPWLTGRRTDRAARSPWVGRLAHSTWDERPSWPVGPLGPPPRQCRGW